MSNLGLFRALDDIGIASAKTAVGDKYVYEYMTKTTAVWAASSPGTLSSASTRQPATAS